MGLVIPSLVAETQVVLLLQALLIVAEDLVGLEVPIFLLPIPPRLGLGNLNLDNNFVVRLLKREMLTRSTSSESGCKPLGCSLRLPL